MAKEYTLQRKHADKFVLYELSVQDPAFEVEFAVRQYRKRRHRRPLVLREDFCGTALNSCRWVAEHHQARAIALDLDQPTLDWAQIHNLAPLGDASQRVDLRYQDVRPVTRPKADVIQAFNFSSYLFNPLAELLTYFRCVRRSLAPGGVFMLDGYGGWDSQQVLRETRTIKSPSGTFGYVWDQADFNPIDSRALCHIHFAFENEKKWKRAFTYHWRIYSPAEMCDALAAAGFQNITVLWDFEDDDDASDFRSAKQVDNCSGWVFYVVAEGSP
jgi:SAM-dependent methyltransferase